MRGALKKRVATSPRWPLPQLQAYFPSALRALYCSLPDCRVPWLYETGEEVVQTTSASLRPSQTVQKSLLLACHERLSAHITAALAWANHSNFRILGAEAAFKGQSSRAWSAPAHDTLCSIHRPLSGRSRSEPLQIRVFVSQIVRARPREYGDNSGIMNFGRGKGYGKNTNANLDPLSS